MHPPSLPDRSVEAYASATGDGRLERLRELAGTLSDVRVLHVNSTATGGGVAELLRSIVPVCNDLGIDTDWLVMDADDDFFEVTKAVHNGLQGSGEPLTDEMKATYREVTERNATEIDSEYDLVVAHDPQPLGMLERLDERVPNAPILWRCHVDLTDPDDNYLAFVSEYTGPVDHAIFSRSAYAAIDAPVVAQVSRFDPWKDQFGTLEAYRTATESIPSLQLALAGGMAGDDPEGLEFYERVADEAVDDPDVHVLTDLPDTTINALQRLSDVVVQKSLREGFGLVVSEALWKRTPVVGSTVGGIPLQIEDGRNGYLVGPEDVTGAGDRLVDLIEHDERRRSFGDDARQRVRKRFLLPRQLVDLLEIFVDALGRES
ncbi:glycosyltransferase [Halobiforma nitratireducens]|uniref:Group 1 glycosyl transferase n=1 Tax=Halobiforma nitratireducens JCM 10879 TaxID=1227454 RepID=M0M3T6_9EURY|nr:glycosyltransferase [Halobiforma nitratireducens]EMA40058.1 group 1 glycosyl transferase [Halobiforma nitratireducens JCM 10879]